VLHRRHDQSLTSQREKAYEGALLVVGRIADEVESPRLRRVARATARRIRRTRAFGRLREGDWRGARELLAASLAQWPFDPKALAALALSYAPARLREALVGRIRRGHVKCPNATPGEPSTTESVRLSDE